MKPSCCIALGLCVAASLHVTGCRGTRDSVSEHSEVPTNYAEQGPTLRPTGTRQLQLQMLKELSDATMKYDEERAKRVSAEKEIERYQTEADRFRSQGDQASKAMAASGKRIADLETQLAAVQAEAQRLKRELELAERTGIELKTRMETEKQRGDRLEIMLLSEQEEHVKTRTKWIKIQIEMAKRELAASQGRNGNNP